MRYLSRSESVQEEKSYRHIHRPRLPTDPSTEQTDAMKERFGWGHFALGAIDSAIFSLGLKQLKQRRKK